MGGGRLAAARTAWLPAHLTYERLGAAYDAFGDFDQEIDGRPAGLAGGVISAQWTGFYRLEFGLWPGQGAGRLSKVADTLDTDVHGLVKSWPSAEIDLLTIGLRTHEILESALQVQLTGHDDYGSGTTLATTGPTSPARSSCTRCGWHGTRRYPPYTPGWTASARLSTKTRGRTERGLA